MYISNASSLTHVFGFYNFFFTAFNLYDSANLYFLGAPRSQTRGHFSLDRKVTKRSIFAIRLRINDTATTTTGALRRAAARCRMSFMFGYANSYLRFVPFLLCNVPSNRSMQ